MAKTLKPVRKLGTIMNASWLAKNASAVPVLTLAGLTPREKSFMWRVVLPSSPQRPNPVD
jgi:hypothetical protein